MLGHGEPFGYDHQFLDCKLPKKMGNLNFLGFFLFFWIFDSFSKSGKCKTEVADYNVVSDTGNVGNVSFLFDF